MLDHAVHPVSTDDAPDWSLITETIRCPLCEYELRGLTEPRCPECGYTFRWPEVLDPDWRTPPYLFEGGQRSTILSFLYTQIATAFPSRFWKRLRPTMDVRVNDLALYWFLASALFTMIPIGAIFLPEMYVRYTSPFPGTDERLPERLELTIVCSIVFAIWAWLTFGVLMIFRGTMRRTGVPMRHVFRCAIYSSDAGLWCGAMVALLLISDLQHEVADAMQLPVAPAMLLLVASVFALGATYRLCHAYRRYLRFPHAISTAFASQLIVWLAMLLVAMVIATQSEWT